MTLRFMMDSTCSMSKSLPLIATSFSLSLMPQSITYDFGGTRKPSRISVVISIWCEQLLNIFRNPLPSPLFGVAVNPTISAFGLSSLTVLITFKYVSAAAWWLSSTTTMSNLGRSIRLLSREIV